MTTSWSQWNHFNELCPDDPSPGAGYDGKAPVGCVAVAGAQVARYHAWPAHGEQAHLDVDDNHANLISGDFPGLFRDAYDWEAMQDTYNPWGSEPAAAVNAVAEIIYELGVSTDMDYGSFVASGSVSTLQGLNRALSDSFFYEIGTSMTRPGYESAFDAALRQDLLDDCPVPAGIPGHAIVIDGLSQEASTYYYHVNYGWGGVNDGWFTLSNINGDSLDEGILSIEPRMTPLLEGDIGTVTNVDGAVSLAWSFPERRRADVTGFRVHEGHFVSGSLSDQADDFGNWHNHSDAWLIATPGYGGGNCFRKEGQIGRYILRLKDPIIPGGSTALTFMYKAILLDDHFRVEISTNAGISWTALQHVTNTGWDTSWHSSELDLSPYAGQHALLRLEYTFEGGSYYGASGGAWIDDVEVNSIQTLSWSVVADGVSADATGYVVSNRLDDLYHFAVDANDGSQWHDLSPPAEVVVELDPDLDIDGDGMPNGWETTHFGTATGAVASVDTDGDGADNESEYGAGTDPWDADSVLSINSCSLSGLDAVVCWSSVTGKLYSVHRTTDLMQSPPVYDTIASNVLADPPVNEFVDENVPSDTFLFYQIRVAP